MDSQINRNTIKRIIRKRSGTFFIIFGIIFLCGFIVAVSLPPVYRSEATIRVEEQQIPEEFVKSTINDYVDERIEKISQNILRRDKLTEIIEKYDLYKSMRSKASPFEIANKMRKDIEIKNIVTELKSKKIGQAFFITVAFNLSYLGENPETVKNVTEKLSSLFLEEDIKRREERILATTDFLHSELNSLKKEINSYEKKISEFQERHLREMPAEKGYNFQAVLRLERELEQTESRLRLLNQQKILLESQLAKIEPLSPIVVEGKDVATNPNQRLKELYLELTKLRSVYSEKHPDLKKIKSEINELEAQVKTSDASIDKLKRLNQLESNLSEMQGVYGPNHPEIKKIKNEISILQIEVNDLMTEAAKLKISEEKPDNPAYINLSTQINAIKMEIEAIRQDKTKIQSQIDEFQKRIEKSPFIEKELNSLMRDLEVARSKYLEISNKLMEAQVAKNLEGTQQGQRFAVASPAYLPVKPYKPDRLLIVLLSFIVGSGIAFFVTAFQEGIDNTIKDDNQIKEITGLLNLSSVSLIVTSEEKRSKRRKRLMWSIATVLAIGALLIIIDRLYLPLGDLTARLDQIWNLIVERITMNA